MMTHKIAIGIEYNGSDFNGWQKQDNGESVQAAVENGLGFVADHSVALFCAGRTDRGVHAVHQVAHFETSSQRSSTAWVMGTNTRLPSGVRILWAKPVDESFHARFSALSRSYRYVIYNNAIQSAIFSDYLTHHTKPLNIQRMQEAAHHLIGEFDFSSFRASGCQARHAVREITQLAINQFGLWITIDITANAFLYHMVRNIVGVLLVIGREEKPVEWVLELLSVKDRRQAAVTAPANGLFFLSPQYPSHYDIPQFDERSFIFREVSGE